MDNYFDKNKKFKQALDDTEGLSPETQDLIMKDRMKELYSSPVTPSAPIPANVQQPSLGDLLQVANEAKQNAMAPKPNLDDLFNNIKTAKTNDEYQQLQKFKTLRRMLEKR